MHDKIIDGTCITLSSFLTLAQTDEVFKTISLVLTILSAIVVLARNIYESYAKAKSDNKITSDEIKDLIDIISGGTSDIVDKIDNNKDDKAE